MKDSREKPKSDKKKKAIELPKMLLEQARPYLPTQYKSEVLIELGKQEADETEKTRLKAKIDNVMAGKSYDLDFCQAIFKVAMRYKAKQEEAEQLLNQAQQP